MKGFLLFICAGSCFIFSAEQVFAAKEPVIRVLVSESPKVLLKADSDIPLVVKGLAGSDKRLQSLSFSKRSSKIYVNARGFSSKAYRNTKNIGQAVPHRSPVRMTGSDTWRRWCQCPGTSDSSGTRGSAARTLECCMLHESMKRLRNV